MIDSAFLYTLYYLYCAFCYYKLRQVKISLFINTVDSRLTVGGLTVTFNEKIKNCFLYNTVQYTLERT